MNRIALTTLLLFTICTFELSAEALGLDAVPPPLKGWVEWVLHDVKDHKCPFFHDDYGQKRCFWPEPLKLDFSEDGGQFSVKWKVFQKGSVPIPGNKHNWPLNVSVNQHPIAVKEFDGKPFVPLDPGDHVINGHFSWKQTPKRLQLPEPIGLINFRYGGKLIPFPTIDEKGQLWLAGQNGDDGTSAPENKNRLSLRVYRHIVDDIPMIMEVQIELDVAERQRELVLRDFHDKEFIPLDLDSPLPARLNSDHSLRLQIRPGKWTLRLTLRHSNQTSQLRLMNIAGPWPKQETWVFESRPYQRLVEVTGVDAVDPTQTTLPDQWKSLPAYIVDQGRSITLKVIQRGDPMPEPNQLALYKTLWLDFDGNGYTVRDQISGTMTQGWRLDTIADMQLGQVDIDGKAQLITLNAANQQAGVELRNGVVNLTAISRINRYLTTLDASGWRHDFSHISTNLNFPPGWKLLVVTGVDNKADSWVTRWTLLDLFVVLIVAVAIGKLWGIRWAVISLTTLMLIWHQVDAPRFIWLNILIAIALLRVVPPGRFFAILKFYRNLSLLVLIIITVPFVVSQIREALYPQLEKPWQQSHPMPHGPILTKETASQAGAIESHNINQAFEADEESTSFKSAKRAPRKRLSAIPSSISNQIDPNAKVQTGPGIPQWRWRNVRLNWNGPVSEGQQFNIVLLSPTFNRLLNIARVILLTLLLIRLFYNSQIRKFKSIFAHATVISVVFPLYFLFGVNDAHADIPDAKLLKELENKLLAPPECLPDCAQIQSLNLRISEKSIHLETEIHALTAVAIPIPVPAGDWRPSKIGFSDRSATTLYRRNHQQLALLVKKGVSKVAYSGPLGSTDTIKIPLPLPPHRVRFSGNGWSIDGIDKNGKPDTQLVLRRDVKLDPNLNIVQTNTQNIPTFFKIERKFFFGLKWRIENQMTRLSPLNEAANLKLPLLENEAVVTPGLRISDGWLSINFAPGEKLIRWESILKKQDTIKLHANENNQWMEVWQVDYSPIWHIDYSGIPTVYNRGKSGVWTPRWHPWPGESVTLTIDRPKAVAGQTITIDDSLLQITVGKRSTESKLALTIRSSQGGQHLVKLPDHATLLSVIIDDQTNPVRLSKRHLNLPLVPGRHQYQLKWREPNPTQIMYRNKVVDIGVASVNNRINVVLGNERWILLTGGPALGPAVLFWGVLIMILIMAIALGRYAPTPLGTNHWFLLLIGLSQVSVVISLVVIGWLVALGFRASFSADLSKARFNLIQIGLVILTVASLSILIYAVSQGLLGHPSMQIEGNGSSAYNLNWYSDRIDQTLPEVWAISLPLWVYHVLMLLWALWLATALLGWLRWGWDCVSKGGIWRKIDFTQSKTDGDLKMVTDQET